jgi:hypothetical protein
MAKKRSTTAPAPNPDTGKAVYRRLIRLSFDEQLKFIYRLRHYPKTFAGDCIVLGLLKALEDQCGRIREAEREIERAEGKLEARMAEMQDKRGMTPANRETLNHYHRLVEKHAGQRGGKTRALEELVTLPGEQRKGYVAKYKRSCHDMSPRGDMESVRQHVKRLESTWLKR